MNVLEQIRKLDEQKAKLLFDAKKEALERVHAAIKDLNELGFAYKLVSGDGAVSGKKKRNTDPTKRHCPICDMDGHDARAHRNQENKKKFTKAELEERGLA
jgi:hypothetical protein